MEFSGIWKVLDSIPDKKRGEGGRKERRESRKKEKDVCFFVCTLSLSATAL